MPVLKVDVVTAEERLYEGRAKFVVIPGTEGELGILPGHERLLTRMRPGTVRVTLENDEEVILFVAGGFVDVQPEQVIVLADTAVRAHDLDEAKAQEARRAAEEHMQNSHSKFDYARAQAELAEAVAQLAAIERLRKRRR
ncbi:ATP synthase epsilon chain [Ralstonia mannitolilytica]|uniref:F0F1 ATP synthase subunit epsilon n=1 Tax=Ralstonia mannitolilytica TaxID=105219 RepID=UPI0028F50935|nr:F0F1 ATP synthase subunit epsilon [Ralstonia mannitolilytica]CAJ0790212.1 ATP synthase epsilon chain [Ralstonia mannitolilytica]